MKSKLQYIQILTTVPNKKSAEEIAKILSDNNLSACAQIIGPVTSIYKWKGNIDKSKEWLCIVKTRKSLYKKTEKMIKNIHPYELPEIIAISIVAGSPEYLKWISKEITVSGR